MGSYGAVIFLAVIVALAVVVWGVFTSRRSIAITVVAMAVTVLAAGCGWYALAESQSVPWTIGYGVVALLSAGVGIRHMVGSREKNAS